MKDQAGPFIAETDEIKLVPVPIRQWVYVEYVTLGIDPDSIDLAVA